MELLKSAWNVKAIQFLFNFIYNKNNLKISFQFSQTLKRNSNFNINFTTKPVMEANKWCKLFIHFNIKIIWA